MNGSENSPRSIPHQMNQLPSHRSPPGSKRLSEGEFSPPSRFTPRSTAETPLSASSVTSTLSKLEERTHNIISTLEEHQRSQAAQKTAFDEDERWYHEALSKLRTQQPVLSPSKPAAEDISEELETLRHQLRHAEKRAIAAEVQRDQATEQQKMLQRGVSELQGQLFKSKIALETKEATGRKYAEELQQLR